MPTQPLFDDPWSTYEYAARTQLNLTDDWRLESMASSVHAGLEREIERLELDSTLDDRQRWQALTVDSVPHACLPDGLFLVIMRYNRKDKVERRSGFITLNEVKQNDQQ